MTQAEDGKGIGDGPPARRWGWPRIVLISSLALNVLFIGAVVGAGWMHWRDGPDHRRFSFSRGLEQLIQEMPADRKPIAQSVLDKYETEVRPRWKETREARREAFEALRAEPFDEAKAREAFDRVNEVRDNQRQRMGVLTFDLMRQLTPEERHIFLESMRTPRRRPPREDGRKKPPPREGGQ